MAMTWKSGITAEMKGYGESWADIVAAVAQANNRYEYNKSEYPVVAWPSDEFEAHMARMFDAGYGGTEGAHFTVWTSKRVYFPVQYDGAEWCASVSREPDGVATEHVGGG